MKGGDTVNRTEMAGILGVTQPYLSNIFHGRRKPGWKLCKKWEKMIGKDYEWWQYAKTRDVQKLFKKFAEGYND
jgi:hypothetical protein